MLDTDQVFKNIEEGHVRHRNEIEELKSDNKRLRASIVNFEGRLDRLEQIANRVPDRAEDPLPVPDPTPVIAPEVSRQRAVRSKGVIRSKPLIREARMQVGDHSLRRRRAFFDEAARDFQRRARRLRTQYSRGCDSGDISDSESESSESIESLGSWRTDRSVSLGDTGASTHLATPWTSPARGRSCCRELGGRTQSPSGDEDGDREGAGLSSHADGCPFCDEPSVECRLHSPICLEWRESSIEV